CLQYKTFPYTF
nr:immunoglobulin light chain junction region [Macaca mulatta]MOV81729.1 immunoglobulin light chain junction region [Macaca mulatta]